MGGGGGGGGRGWGWEGVGVGGGVGVILKTPPHSPHPLRYKLTQLIQVRRVCEALPSALDAKVTTRRAESTPDRFLAWRGAHAAKVWLI